MQLAGTFRVRQLPRGDAGIFTSVAAIRRAIHGDRAEPIVRAFAAKIVRGCGPQDQGCRAARILQFLRGSLEYLPDPVSVEAIQAPAFLLRCLAYDRHMYGDCDDAAALGATLASSVGLRTRLAVASFLPTRKFHHVWSEALVLDPRAGARWVELDPFRSERFNGKPTRLRYVRV